jgi:hypothetical protein
VVPLLVLAGLGDDVEAGERDVDDGRPEQGDEEVDEHVVVRERVVQPQGLAPAGEPHAREEGEVVRLRQGEEADGDHGDGGDGEVDRPAAAEDAVDDGGYREAQA